MRRILLSVLVALPLATTTMVVSPGHAQAASVWVWPVTGPVIRGYDPPDDPYGSGHRGIDIAVPVGTPVHAVDAGTVTFAGKVGGQLFVTVNHGGGLASTYSWVSALLVHKNDLVSRGQTIALSGAGHPGSTIAHLHLGAKLAGQYVDPMTYLSPLSVTDMIRLAPLPPAG
jgi:murein DD-endopeptidase MepM/ murein hydrolase activator NlpD